MLKSKTEKESVLSQGNIITNRKKASTSQFANVNSYKHFLAVPSANQSYIQWAFGLRGNQDTKLVNSSAVPPETYYKTIESRKMKHTSADMDENVNVSQFEHLVLHRLGPHPSCGQLKFQTTLRLSSKQKLLNDKERKWNSIPKKDRHEEPVLIKSKSLRKKLIEPEETEGAIDGLTKYPKFTEKIIKTPNVNQFRHMIKGRINLPSISWQVNLRSY